MNIKSTLTLLFLGLLVIGCRQNKTEPQQNIALDMAVAPDSVELFAEGIISTALYERDLAITPDGTELIYSLGDYKQNKRVLVHIRNTKGKWNNPEILNISGTYHDIEPFFAQDGQRLFFASNRPIEPGSERNDYNIWYSDRDGEIWGEPKALNEKINTEMDEFYPSVSANGNLYFTASREEGIGREDIFVSKKINGTYQEAEVLDSTVNTIYYEFNAYVSPDENLLIFSSFGREDGYGGGDLYFSVKDKDGKWSKAQNMGAQINSPYLDYCPFVDLERKNFYFTSERKATSPESINSIEELKAFSNNVRNGMGNVYRIGTKALKLD